MNFLVDEFLGLLEQLGSRDLVLLGVVLGRVGRSQAVEEGELVVREGQVWRA